MDETHSHTPNAMAKAPSKIYNINVSISFSILCAFFISQKIFAIQLDVQHFPSNNWKVLCSKYSSNMNN